MPTCLPPKKTLSAFPSLLGCWHTMVRITQAMACPWHGRITAASGSAVSASATQTKTPQVLALEVTDKMFAYVDPMFEPPTEQELTGGLVIRRP